MDAGEYPFFAGRRTRLREIRRSKTVQHRAGWTPTLRWGPNEVGLWHRTLIPRRRATPATLPCPQSFPARRELPTSPASRRTHVRFVVAFAHAGAHGWVYTDEALPVAGKLLTEILSYDLKCPAFTLDHGGTLTDDAVDEPHKWEGLTEDKVGPPGDLLTEFSYLRPTDNV